jgi:polysaccharide biosynthesis protein VpsQ
MTSVNRQHQLWAILYGCAFLVILVLAYTGKLPGVLTGNDKLGHLVLYAIATFLGHRALAGRRWFRGFNGWSIPLFPALFGLFTVVEEFCQSLSPNRTFDLGDLVASFVGIAIGWAWAEWRRNVDRRSAEATRQKTET